jgi:hypothetical protein
MAAMRDMTPCRHCGGERDTCPRCGYLACPCEPCACKTGRASQAARTAMASYDANGGRSDAELARAELRELVRVAKGGRPE